MRHLLEESNADLLSQSKLLIQLIDATNTSPLLTRYRERVRELCAQMASDAQRNLDDLALGLPGAFETILSNTQADASYLDLIGSRFTGPILRARPEDEVMLAVLAWLHSTDMNARTHPFAFGDGNFAVYNDLKLPAMYFLPASRQLTLLYIPLFFHEFGHVLYRFHKLEMDELVKEFQQIVAAHAAPTTIRDRTGSSADDEFRIRLVRAWYPWVQEFFCDAVGLHIGGPAYLKAFSHYLRFRSRDQYYRPRKDQLDSKHPVTMLRIRMLADRAKSLGMMDLANAIEADWSACAKLMKVQEDFEGTWSEEFFVPLRNVLSNMIEEAAPTRWDAVTDGVVMPSQLSTQAWSVFEQSRERYWDWEIASIREIRAAVKGGTVFGLAVPPAV